jgi:chromatin remodeling complex protein RSC6
MGKTTTTTPKTTAPVETAPVVAAAAAVETTPVRRGKKDKAPPAQETVAPPAPETVSVAAVPDMETAATAPETETAAPVEATSMATKIQEFGAKLQQMSSLFSSMKSDYKALERTFVRELKTAQKSSRKKRTPNANRAPSGFVKPTLISPQLAEFLGKSAGIEMARTDVSREINAYIREKGLQDKENGRKIHPDANLSKLLAIGETDELTYFNIQRFMKHHFIKADATAATTSA